MNRLRVSLLPRLLLVLATVSWGAYQSRAAASDKDQIPKMTPKQMTEKKVKPAQRKAAASTQKAKKAGAAAAGLPATAALVNGPPTGALVADYFGTTPNWAFSPIPTLSGGTLIPAGNPLTTRTYATDGASTVFVIVPTPLPGGSLQSFQTFNQPGSAGNTFNAYVLRPGTANQYQVVYDSGPLIVPALPLSSPGQVETFLTASIPVNAGDVMAFYGSGIPLDIGAGADVVSFPAPAGPLLGSTITLGDASFPLLGQARTYSFSANVLSGAGALIGGMRKFKDELPDLKTLIATPDIVTYPGSDYYEIELVEYSNWQFHTDLGVTTKLRGYRQTNNGTDKSLLPCTPLPACANTIAPPALPSYLGPVIVATKNQPTRIQFTNRLPLTGAGGELFFPADTTVMGAGMGPDGSNYPENRGTLHLHGGFTPWVSDGTPHQWVTPNGESGTLTTGVSTQPVPDMAIPAGDSMTFYWPNQQSGRLMFYHDHAYGITRLNVYAGEAAGYLIRDDGDTMLEAIPGFPGLADNIPLVIQDKTFVWGTPPADCLNPTGATGTWATDPTWCDPTQKWAQAPGSLWFPHVYMPNQNPWDLSGANAMGRWDYALWFWPPYTGLITNDVLPNPYYDPILAPWEPPSIPGTPNPSLVPEAFMDTPVVNGKAYPFLNVPAGPVRFRILNAANDRFWNLSLFVADPAVTTSDGRTNTEVKMVPFNRSQDLVTPFPDWWYAKGLPFTFDDRMGGVPDPTTRGPAMIQIGNEGGLLPAPAVVKNQPVNYTYNRKDIVVLSVQEHALFLGPAERADVIVDFTNFAGKTLILYNDAPAPLPAGDQRVDYYTGDPDNTDTGGAPSTLPGFGPNTRTIMQIVVGGGGGSAPVDDVGPVLAALSGPAPAGLPGAFAKFSDPIIVPQTAYNAAYPATPTAADLPGVNASRISDTSLTFKPLGAVAAMTFDMRPKAIQELFELDYGRMNATLGIELPFTNAGNQTTIPLGYNEPTTEFLDAAVSITAPTAPNDGTQIWKITHNGVDTHAIHFHLFNVQVVNRVGWDGAIRLPDANELGWKETVRMNPLEDIIVAMRPTTPLLPFGIPLSTRPLAPSLPPGALINTFDPLTGAPLQVSNDPTDFGWEYVWHCHLLGHEENDMMRPMQFNVPRALPLAPSPPVLTDLGLSGVSIAWTDPTPFDYNQGFPQTNLGNPANEIGFRVEKVNGGTSTLTTTLANVTTFTDTAPLSGVVTYNVYAVVACPPPATSGLCESPAATAQIGVLAAPSGLTATAVSTTQVNLAWTLYPGTATGISIYRDGVFVTTVAGTATAFNDTGRTEGTTYSYYLTANGAGGPSPASGPATATTPLIAPNLSRVATGTDFVEMRWVNGSAKATSMEIWKSTAGGSFVLFTTVTPATLPPLTPTWLDDPVLDGTTYSYRLVATSPISRSAASNTITTTTSLFAPTGLVLQSATTTTITMKWTIGDPATTANGYLIERAPGNNGGTFVQVGSVTGAGTLAFTNTGLTKSTTYRYRVRAYKTTPALNSTYTNTLVATTPKK